MDLSKYNDADYEELKKGNVRGLSDAGYETYKQQHQQYSSAQQQAANPQTIPDLADKAAHPQQQFVDQGQKERENYYKQERQQPWTTQAQHILMGDPSAPESVKGIGGDIGSAALAMPVEAAPAALSKIAAYLGKSGVGPAMGRVAANAGIGYAQGGATGALVGGGLGALGEVVGGVAGAAKNLFQTGKMALNPAGAQDRAIAAIDDATGKLKSSEAENLAHYLGDKTLSIDTTGIRGVHPEIDELLSAHASKVSPYGDIPSELEIPATDAHKIRQLLDGEMSYKKLGPFAQTSETAARDAAIKPQADQLRGQIHDLSPDVSDTLDQWSDNLNAARNLDKRAQTAPMTVLSSPSFDRRALLQKVDEQAGTDLQGLGSQITNAKDLSNAFHNGGVHPIDAALTLGRAGAQGSLRGNKVAIPADAALQGLFGNKQGQ